MTEKYMKPPNPVDLLCGSPLLYIGTVRRSGEKLRFGLDYRCNTPETPEIYLTVPGYQRHELSLLV